MDKQKYVFCGECNAYGVFLMMAKSAYRYAANNFKNVEIGVHVQSATEEVKIVHSSINCMVVGRDCFICPTCQDWFEMGGEDAYKHVATKHIDLDYPDPPVTWHCHQDCWHEATYGREEDPQYDHPGETPDLWDTHPEQMRLRQEVKE
jgi:hypothetical protein